jgi:hypothetical protein
MFKFTGNFKHFILLLEFQHNGMSSIKINSFNSHAVFSVLRMCVSFVIVCVCISQKSTRDM